MENYEDTEKGLNAEELQSVSGGLSPDDGIPMDQIIGGPMRKCVENQAKMATTTLDFIARVGCPEGYEE